MHQKCIRNASEILAMAPTSENLNSIRNASEIFIPSPDQFLNIFCVLHTHPQLQHLILNFHISQSPTHPKIINNFSNANGCQTKLTSLNFFPPRTTYFIFYTSTPNYCTLSSISTFQHIPPMPKLSIICKMQMAAKQN